MFARCPACHTVFRVRPEQLRAHLGQVRCGNCFNAFNALEHLQEESAPTRAVPSLAPSTVAQASPTAQPAPPAASADTPDRLDNFFVLEDKPEDSFSDQLDFEIPDTLVASRGPGGQATDTRTEPGTNESPSFIFESSATNSQGSDTAATPFVEAAKPWRHIRAEVQQDAESFDASLPRKRTDATSLEEPETELPPEPESPSGPQPGFASEPEQSAHAPFILPASEIEHQDVAEPRTQQIAAPDLSHLDETYGPPAAAPTRRWLSGLGIGVLAGTLAAQSIFLFRAEIARDWPALRPALVAACRALNCSVALPRVAGAISVEASDLQAEPGKPGHFVLNATIRNRAPHPQAYPHLELTLTDARDRPLARRVLAPQDWTPGADIEGGFDAGRDIAVTLPFEATGLDAAGYRIYVFYP